MKRILLFVTLMILSTPFAFAQKTAETVVINNSIPVKKAEHLTADNEKWLQPGDTVEVLGYNPETKFYTIKHKGEKKYVYQSMIDLAKTDNIDSPDEPTPTSNTNGSRTIHTGPRGGRYYINKNGNKTYVKKN